ncbi:MAG: hypothetical protein ACFFDN_38860 [Candidatus Hodarchaeota archaeon]
MQLNQMGEYERQYDNFCSFQDNLHKMIGMVLNSQIFTPNSIRHFKALKDLCYKKLSVLGINFERKPTNQMDVICDLYKGYLSLEYPELNDFENTAIAFSNKIELSDYNEEISNFLAELEKIIHNKMASSISGVFVHGSISTNDYTDFSDFDAGIIVKNEVMLNPHLLKGLKENIKRALKIILKFDNLQHHGFFIIPEGFLDHYPEEYLPLEVFKFAKSLSNPFKVKIKIYRNLDTAREKFLRIADTLDDDKFKPPSNLYEIKRLLSGFMLLPTFYLQIRGIYIYKKFSFDLVREEFLDSWWVMDRVSQLRQDWIRPKSNLFDALSDIVRNPWLTSAVYRKFNWQSPEWLSNNLNNKLYDGMKSLVAKMAKKI